jgi:hypothetical protein
MIVKVNSLAPLLHNYHDGRFLLLCARPMGIGNYMYKGHAMPDSYIYQTLVLSFYFLAVNSKCC